MAKFKEGDFVTHTNQRIGTWWHFGDPGQIEKVIIDNPDYILYFVFDSKDTWTMEEADLTLTDSPVATESQCHRCKGTGIENDKWWE